MTDFTGRILPLLWRRTMPARKAAGRPPRLSIDLVVTTGVRIADRDGLEAASMARVAAELSVATMTLYTYVPSRDDLVELMVDEALGERDLAAVPAAASWRERVRFYADRTFAMYRAHPWLARVSQIRPPLGPGMLAEREFMLATVAGLGLPITRINAAALTLSGYVTAAAQAEAENLLINRATGLTTEDWWQQRGEFWENWFDVEAHPTMTALWNGGGFDRGAGEQAEDAYEYGLRLLLDGIEADAKGSSAPS
ncbi:MAG: TetR/AcrR family transcriptional regulator C-terminal domain-containing protein [Actinoplanes sp.]